MVCCHLWLNLQKLKLFFTFSASHQKLWNRRGNKGTCAHFFNLFWCTFMPQNRRYGQLLWNRINSTKPNVVTNTGWSGGSYGEGERISIELTRKILKFILNSKGEFQTREDRFFNFSVPIEINEVPKNLLNPRDNWTNQEGYDSAAAKLKAMFVDNFKQFPPINEKVDGVYDSLKND